MMKCPYDEKADLWSVGVMMYQLYYKKIPYDGKTEKDILDRIIIIPISNQMINILEIYLIKYL